MNKKKALVITPTLPWPANKGERIRCSTVIESLSADYEIDLVNFEKASYSEQGLQKGLKICKSIKNFKINKLFAYLRLALAIFSSYSLTNAFNFSFSGKSYLKKIDYEQYDLIFVFSSNIYENLPKINHGKIFWDLIDVDSNKWKRFGLIEKNLFKKFIYSIEAKRLRKVEEQITQLAAKTFVINKREQQSLADTQVLNAVNTPEEKREDYVNFDQQLIVFSGQMDYFPNVDAVLYFDNEVFPKIKEKYPDAEFLVVGRNPSKNLIQKCKFTNFTGEVDDVEQCLKRAHLTVVPLRYLFGSPTKVLETFSMQVPLIGTAELSEIYDISNQQEYLSATSVEDYVWQISSIFENNDLRTSLISNAWNYLIKNHSLAVCKQQMGV